MEQENELYLLFDWLSDERNEAVLLYLKLRQRLIFIFGSMKDAEDLADEAIDRALRNIKNGKVDFSGNPFHYIAKIAHYVKLEEFKKKKILQLDDKINILEASSQESDSSEELYQIIEKCLEELPAEDKKLFLEYTFAPTKEHRESLSRKGNISLEHLRVKIHRIKGNLRECANKKLEQ